jgi:hypothetical protein
LTLATIDATKIRYIATAKRLNLLAYPLALNRELMMLDDAFSPDYNLANSRAPPWFPS